MTCLQCHEPIRGARYAPPGGVVCLDCRDAAQDTPRGAIDHQPIPGQGARADHAPRGRFGGIVAIGEVWTVNERDKERVT